MVGVVEVEDRVEGQAVLADSRGSSSAPWSDGSVDRTGGWVAELVADAVGNWRNLGLGAAFAGDAGGHTTAVEQTAAVVRAVRCGEQGRHDAVGVGWRRRRRRMREKGHGGLRWRL